MIIMKRRQSVAGIVIRMLIVIPFSVSLMLAVASCSGSRRSASRSVESPPPPPPAPSRRLPADKPAEVQKVNPEDVIPSEVFVVVEEMPRYPGGDTALMQYVYKNLRYPPEAKAKGIQGRVILRFCVNAAGSVDRVAVLRGVDPILDNEAVRVISSLTGWIPGRQGGKPVNVWYSIPVTFGLSESGSGYRPRYFVVNSDTIYTYIKEMPQFPGGRETLNNYRETSLKYPDAAKNTGLGGTVSIRFIVDINGNLSDFNIISGVSPALDAEALRVARLMPQWIPGREGGKPVKVQTGTVFIFNPNPGAPPSEVFVVVEEMPVFPGGDSMLIKYIADNIHYPAAAKEKNIQGRVILRFCINYLGGIEQVGVLKGVDPELDSEAIRVIKTLPKWQPGKQGGKPVNVWYSVPVTFALSDAKKMDPKEALISPPAPPAPPPPPPPPPSGYDQPPEFNGGETAIAAFIESEKRYPQAAREKNIEGTVKVRFTINDEGMVENAMISSSADPSLDAEALRIIKLLKPWQPGRLKGKPVKVSYTFPVIFKL